MSSSAAETFVQETLDGLDSIEDLLLALESDPSPERIDDTFRILHTIKGSGAMFGFDALSNFTHHFETAFDLVREGRLPLTKDLIDVALESRDYMGNLLQSNEDPEALKTLQTSELAVSLTARIGALISQVDDPTASATPASGVTGTSTNGTPRAVVIQFKPEPTALKNGMRPDLLVSEVADFGEAQIQIDDSAVPPLEDMDPQLSYLSWTVEVQTSVPLDDVKSVFIFADDAELSIAEALKTPVPDDAERGVGTEKTHPASDQPTQKAAAGPQKSDTLRVPAARLDELMDQLGELVIAQARLDRVSETLSDQTLVGVAEEIGRLVTTLRDSTLAMRMLPIEVVFGKFRRVVRSLSDQLGKDCKLVTQGGETELDKNVIDSLTEPLVHMIRNSIDHGIESAEVRMAAGKPPEGSIYLSARQSGGEVLISVADDGGGLNLSAIRQRALERGLTAEGVTPTEEELCNMIFEPAFSTAKELSAVSGRGVGMDAVKKAVSDLRGTTEIDMRPGEGTRITLRLPVTLAIIDSLLVRVGVGVFAVPLNAVSECVELSETERRRESGRTLLQIRDELVPFLNLDDVFEFEKSTEPTRRVVIVNADGRRVGLVVDDTLGQHQTVIKTFSQFHRNLDGFAGSTILGDGRVALILDVPALLKSCQPSSTETNRRDAA